MSNIFYITRRGFVGSLLGVAAAKAFGAQQGGSTVGAERQPGKAAIKITDLKCAIIGRNPVVRIVTDQGISGYGEAESAKPYLKPMVLFYKPYLIGEDPTDVGRIMLKIRRMGAFKPWGAAVSAIEIALWDVAGQAAGQPVYKLLGGKIRDRVRPYGNSENNGQMELRTPQDYAELAQKVKEAKEGYTLVKFPVGFHNAAMMNSIPNAWYGQHWTGRNPPYMDRGPMTEQWHRPCRRLRRSHQEGLWRSDRAGLRLRARLDPKGCHPLCPCRRAVSPRLARRPDHRRLRALPEGPGLQAGERQHDDAHSHRRRDLPARELHGADRDAGGRCARARPGGCGR
jgi:hypothetical protein